MKAPCLAAALLAATGLATRLEAAVILNPLAWGLNPGDTFRLVVITAGGTTATSTSITTYDAFVNTQGLSGITYNGASLSWQAIGLTPGSSPLTDSSRYSSTANSTRIYNLNGLAVSNTTAGSLFWRTSPGNTHLNPINWTINGSGNLAQLGDSTKVWTGFDYNGAVSTEWNYNSSGGRISQVTAALGQSAAYNSYNSSTRQLTATTLYPSVGRAGASANGWASLFDAPSLSTSYSMYAMSELITVTAAAGVPEPGTRTLSSLLAGTIGVGFWYRRRTDARGKAPAAPNRT